MRWRDEAAGWDDGRQDDDTPAADSPAADDDPQGQRPEPVPAALGWALLAVFALPALAYAVITARDLTGHGRLFEGLPQDTYNRIAALALGRVPASGCWPTGRALPRRPPARPVRSAAAAAVGVRLARPGRGGSRRPGCSATSLAGPPAGGSGFSWAAGRARAAVRAGDRGARRLPSPRSSPSSSPADRPAHRARACRTSTPTRRAPAQRRGPAGRPRAPEDEDPYARYRRPRA